MQYLQAETVYPIPTELEAVIWTALLVYVLLRFLAFTNKQSHSFSRFIAMLRAVLWDKFSLSDLIKAYGTADALKRTHAALEQAYLPGFQ